jgi:hypothetical protein
MKKLVTFWMMAAMAGLVAGPASAALVNTTFEADSAGAGTWVSGDLWSEPDPASSVNWVGTSGTATTATIYSYEGDQCMRVTGGSTNKGSRLYFGENQNNTGVYEITWATRVVANGTTSNTATTFMNTNEWDALAGIRTDVTMSGATITDVSFVALHAGGETTVLTGGVSGNSKSTWYEMKVTLDLPDGTFDVAINLVGSGTVYSATDLGLTDTGDFDALRTIVTGSGSYHWFDSIQVVPEPATMVLLGLGGVGLLIRRRRRS